MSHKFKDRVRKDLEFMNVPQGHDPQAQDHQQQQQEEAAVQTNDHPNLINQENPDNQKAAAAGAAIQEDVHHQNYQDQLHGAAALPQNRPLHNRKRIGAGEAGRNKDVLLLASLIQNPPVPTQKRTPVQILGEIHYHYGSSRGGPKTRGRQKGNVGRHQLAAEAHFDKDEYESYESPDPPCPEDDSEEDPSYYKSPCKEDTTGSKRRRPHDDDKDPPARFNKSFRPKTPRMRSTSVK